MDGENGAVRKGGNIAQSRHWAPNPIRGHQGKFLRRRSGSAGKQTAGCRLRLEAIGPKLPPVISHGAVATALRRIKLRNQRARLPKTVLDRLKLSAALRAFLPVNVYIQRSTWRESSPSLEGAGES